MTLKVGNQQLQVFKFKFIGLFIIHQHLPSLQLVSVCGRKIADFEGNKRSSRSCKIAAFGIGGKGMASSGGAAP